MKKIIIGIITISYLLISFIYLQVYSVVELESIYRSNVKSIIVTEWGNDVSNESKLKEIDKLSQDMGINIYKVSYNQLTNSDEIIINIYTSLGDENKLKDKFDIKYNESIEGLLLNGGSLSSEDKEIGAFNKNLIIRIKSLNEAINENIVGEYLIQTDDSLEFSNIKEEFTDKLNFTLDEGNAGDISNESDLLNVVKPKYVMLVLILLIAVVLTFIYYIVFRYKEFAIKKMLGHSDGKIIFKDMFKEVITIHFSALIISALIIAGYLYYYNRFTYTFGYLKNLSILLIVFSTILIFIEMVVSLNIDNIKIKNMLNNKKPIVLIQSLNYISKVTFSIVLITIIINLLSNYNNLIAQNKNLDKWKSTNEYVYVDMTDRYRDEEEEIWNYNQSLRCKEFFKYYNNKVGLLVNPSDYIVYKDFFEYGRLKERREYDPIEGNVLGINAEYLRQNQIYDEDDNVISIEDEYGDYLKILVPEKYKNIEEELLELYEEWYKFRRFTNEDMYNEHMNIEKVEHPDVRVEIIYTKNGQESFLYNPSLEVENQNSITDAIHFVVNSENMGEDLYVSCISGEEFFIKIDGSLEGDAYSKISDDIKLLNMDREILSANTLYSQVDSYIYKLQNEINEYVVSMIITFILEILLTIYIIVNYIKRNKYINAIKKINGYSYLKRHNKFMLLIVVTWIAILTGVSILGMLPLIYILKVIVPIIILELLIMYIVLKKIENNEILSVLKIK